MDITNLIGSIGFPIACCIYLISTNNKAIADLEKTLNAHTEVLTKLCTKLDLVTKNE